MSTVKRTNPPKGFLTPSELEISTMAKELGIEKLAPTLAADLANIFAGGEVVEITESDIRAAVVSAAPNSTEKYIQMEIEKQFSYHTSVSNFLNNVKLEDMPSGTSPLERAIKTLSMLGKKAEGKEENIKYDDGDAKSIVLPIFVQRDGKSVADAIYEDTLDLKKLDGNEKALLGVAEMKPADAAYELSKRSEGYKAIIQMAKKLDAIKQLQAKPSKKTKSNPDGGATKMRPSVGFADLPMVSSQDLAMRSRHETLFNYQLATGQMPITEKVDFHEQKQCLFVLVDCSGSMKGQRADKARAVILNRCKAVMENKAVLYICFFDVDITPPVLIDNKKIAAEFFQKLWTEYPIKDRATETGKAINFAAQYIKDLPRKAYKPELLIVTDDDASTGKIDWDLLKGIAIHGIALCDNASLKKATEKTGGIFARF